MNVENEAVQVDVEENVEAETVDTENQAVEMTEVERGAVEVVEKVEPNPTPRVEGRIRCFCLYPGGSGSMCNQIVELVEPGVVEMTEDVEMPESVNEEAMQVNNDVDVQVEALDNAVEVTENEGEIVEVVEKVKIEEPFENMIADSAVESVETVEDDRIVEHQLCRKVEGYCNTHCRIDQ